MRTALRATALVFVSAGLLFAGCGEEPAAPEPQDPRDPNGTDIPIDVTDPDALLASWARALEARDLPVYSALLAVPGDRGADDPGFVFDYQMDEIDCFPWAPCPRWDRSVELAIAGNMFSPGFQGGAPPVQSISVTYDVLWNGQSVDVTGAAAEELVVDAVITVRNDPENAWTADTRLAFRVASDSGGHLRIGYQKELPKLTGRVGKLWGEIKELYR